MGGLNFRFTHCPLFPMSFKIKRPSNGHHSGGLFQVSHQAFLAFARTVGLGLACNCEAIIYLETFF